MFNPGDRITNGTIKADVLKVSKDGKRIRIEFWGRGMQDGKLVREWAWVDGWKLA